MRHRAQDYSRGSSEKRSRTPTQDGTTKSNSLNAEALRDAFLDWLRLERRASPHTVIAYGGDLANLLSFLSRAIGSPPTAKDLAELTTKTLRGWMAADAGAGASNATRARRLAAVRTFYRFLARNRGISNLAPRAMEMPHYVHRLPRPLKQGQALAVVRQQADNANPENSARQAALFSLLYGSGLRLGEALALNVGQAPLPGKSNALRVMGKGSRERLVPILPAVRDAVARYLEHRPNAAPEDPLFLGARGKRLDPSVVQKEYRALRDRLGLPANSTPHALRHSCASHLLSNGVDLRHVQELLGHVSLASTQVYTFVDETMLERAAKLHPRR